MKKTKLSLLAIALVVCAFAVKSADANEINIYHDYDSALALSAETGKPVLIDFYFDT